MRSQESNENALVDNSRRKKQPLNNAFSKNTNAEVAAIVTFAREMRFSLHGVKVPRQLEDLKELETAERMLTFHSTSTYIAEITCTKGFEKG